MKFVASLIDNAVKMCDPPTRYELAKRINVDEKNLAAVYHGRRPMPLRWIARIAQVAGTDEGQAVLRVLAERDGGKSLGGMAAAIGGVGMLLFSYSSSVFQTPQNLTIATAMVDLLRIVSRKRRPVYQGANPA